MAVATTFRIALACFLPDRFQRHALVRLQFLVDLIRLRVFAPDGGTRPVGEQPISGTVLRYCTESITSLANNLRNAD
jgi:hypothetical protein